MLLDLGSGAEPACEPVSPSVLFEPLTTWWVRTDGDPSDGVDLSSAAVITTLGGAADGIPLLVATARDADLPLPGSRVSVTLVAGPLMGYDAIMDAPVSDVALPL